jgi:long-chain acyl-CoA synthetase
VERNWILAEDTIIQRFWHWVSSAPDKQAIMHKVEGVYRPVIWREHGRIVELVAGGLTKLIQPGEHVAIMSQSRPAWTWADIAVLSCGGATIPIYPTLAPPEVHYLVNHSDAVGVFVENERQARKILDLPELPSQLRFIVIIEGDLTAIETRVRCLTWDDLLKDGEVNLLANPNELPERIKAVTPDSMASIVYTSGTTGVPKGVILTHGNIHSVCGAMSKLVGFDADDLSLSFLPLSHVYERVGGQFLAIYQGLTMAYAESMEAVAKNLVEVKPTVLNGVPRFYEKAYQKIQAEIRNMPTATQYLIRWALALGKRAEKYQQKAPNDDLVKQIYRQELRVADRLVFSKIRKRFGGRLRIMVSGAAPLSEDVQSFFNTIGLQIVEGYGLTETSAPISCNTPETNKVGTVGKPLPGVEVKIASDGEILARGASIFCGYYKNPDATNESLHDGWFSTGDIGEFDSQGYLRITDRKKDIIITSGGKHVAPQFIENMFKGETLISNILVHGDRRKYITALITLSKDGLESFCKKNQIEFTSIGELTHNPRVRLEVERLVAKKNEELAQFERIKKFEILDADFSTESDELTPTFKLKRKKITEKYQKLLNGLYDLSDLEVAAPGKVAEN